MLLGGYESKGAKICTPASTTRLSAPSTRREAGPTRGFVVYLEQGPGYTLARNESARSSAGQSNGFLRQEGPGSETGRGEPGEFGETHPTTARPWRAIPSRAVGGAWQPDRAASAGGRCRDQRVSRPGDTPAPAVARATNGSARRPPRLARRRAKRWSGPSRKLRGSRNRRSEVRVLPGALIERAGTWMAGARLGRSHSPSRRRAWRGNESSCWAWRP
jgi:hypothetical protein